MNLKMQLGAEPKKVAILGGLVLFGAYSFYTNVLSGPDIPAGAKSSQKSPSSLADPTGLPQAPTPAQIATQQRLQQRKSIIGRPSIGEFRPVLKPSRKEDQPDPMKVDPTLRLDLLAKLQTVTIQGGHRSLFDMGQAPPPTPVNVPNIIPGKIRDPKTGKLIDAPKPATPTPVAAATPTKPPPPPIPLKFYGYSSQKAGGPKRAFFLEGEEIYVVMEGDIVRRRYRIVRIGLNSVIVEDTEFKHQQTMPLEEPPVTG